MREVFAIIYIVLIVLLGLFGVISKKSSKAIGKAVSYLLFTFIVPIAGNLILVLSENELLSTIGSYTYFIGMDLMAFSLFDFTLSYCNIPWRHNKKIYFIYTLLTIDIIQYFFNPFFGHAFGMEAITVDGSLYYRLVPYLGQTFHRIAVYIAFITSLGIFIYKTIRVPHIYAEKYYIILFTMVLAGIWQSYYIFSRTPIDRSMMGLAVCGMLIFYFSLFYRPFRLLDRMLANIASKMSEAIFFFELFAMFDDLGVGQDNWSSKQSVNSEKGTQYFTLDMHIVTDAKNKKIGYFLSIQDNTEEILKHQQEIYEATHDKLTGLFTKEHLFNQIKNKVSSETETSYSIAYLDIKDFKMVNDIFGNDTGDLVLKRVANPSVSAIRQVPKNSTLFNVGFQSS